MGFGIPKGLAILAILGIIFATCEGQKTNFINHQSKVSKYDEPQWFEDNIPFVEVPIQEIEDVYYYRWSSLKRHLRYTIPGAGYIITEFVHAVGYSLKFDTINAAAGHHINEARWLRDKRYVQDYINFWTREGGDPNRYSEWITDSAFNAFLVNGDEEFIKSQLVGFVRNYNNWRENYNDDWKLYWISPHWDAMEFSCSSVQTDDPYHGGAGYRPSFNSEMYGNAIAISKIAALAQDFDTFLEFQARADSLKQAIIDRLWDKERKFFYHAYRDDNPNFQLLDSREEIGFYPWQWQIPPTTAEYTEAWDQLFDPEGFGTAWGPTTCEARSQWYDGNQTSQCCWWNGNSWPYSTSFTLKSLAAQVRDYGNSPAVTTNEFVELLQKYALTQYKNDEPYVAECHSPIVKNWVCDGFNHSEHYAHSTYTDNVLSDLIGITPRSDNVFEIRPLVPNNWRWFAAENIPYHGHEITVLYDADGSYYESGHSGLQIFVNGEFVNSQPNIGRLTVNIPPPSIRVDTNKVENYASNPYSQGYPEASASFTSAFASEWHPLDGRVFYDYNPLNRWSNFGSGTPTDWYAVDFGPGRAKNISQVKLYVYSDVVTREGGCDCPKKMEVEVYLNGAWQAVSNQKNTPENCSPNNVNILDFDPVSTQKVRVVFTRDVANDYYVGITELEIWAPWPQAPSPQTYEAEDGLVTRGEILESPVASGHSFVDQLSEEDSSVEITGVWAPAAGTYALKVNYANIRFSEATHRLLLNNQDEVTIHYGKTEEQDGFDTVAVAIVPLQRGNNVLIFRKGNNVAALDKIEITETFHNPIFDGNSADPSVVWRDGSYYLSLSTRNELEITLFKSPILTSFRDAEKSVIFTAPEGFRDIWASEMHEVDGELYLYFCMSGIDGSGIHMYVIKADDPKNPMGNWGTHTKVLPGFQHGSTDGTVFQHGGKQYLVWGSTASLWIGPMLNATTVGEEKMVLRSPTLDWECSLDVVSGEYPCIVEGPYFIYSQNVSYLIFSAGSTFGPDYVMGMMSIEEGKDPMNRDNWWFGDDKPVFWRNDAESVYTTGHATFTTSPAGRETWVVYHGSDHPGDPRGNRVARVDKMSFDVNGKPVFPRPSGYAHTLPVPSGQRTFLG